MWQFGHRLWSQKLRPFGQFIKSGWSKVMNRYRLLASVSASTVAFAGGAVAADLPVKAAPAQVWTANWSGFYFGINGGVLTHQSTTKDLNNWADVGYVPSQQLKATGGLAGGQLGWNWQEDAFVYGIEADIDWASATATNRITGCPGCGGGGGAGGGIVAIVKSEVNWLATFRGRVGLTVGNAGATLVYVTGGGALAGIENRWGAGYATGPASRLGTDGDFVTSKNTWGWVAGAGIEHRLRSMPNLSFKAEALWIQFENRNVTNPGPSKVNGSVQTFNTQFENEMVVGRVGLNYRF
jgi:outer membrane immunogenic protein